MLSAIVGQPESEDVGGFWSGAGLHQDVACAAERRTVTVTSVTPGRKGLSTSRQGCMDCVTQTVGWLELKGEVLSSEEHWLRATAPSLKPPPLCLPSPPPLHRATAERSSCFPPPGVVMCVCVSVCLCWNAASPSAGACVCECVGGCARVCVSVCLE